MRDIQQNLTANNAFLLKQKQDKLPTAITTIYHSVRVLKNATDEEKKEYWKGRENAYLMTDNQNLLNDKRE